MASGVLVVIETSAGKVRESCLELLTPARELAQGEAQGPSKVTAVVIGSGIEEVAKEISSREVDRTLYVDSPTLERYTTDGYARAVEAAISEADPRLVLFAGTTSGRDLGPYIAARAGTTCLTDCVSLHWDDGGLVGQRPVYQGKMLTDVRIQPKARGFAVVRSGVFQPPAASGRGSAEPLHVNISEGDLRVKLKDVAEKPTGGVNLEAAETVVVGGRGVGSAENFQLVEELAQALDAPVGATRAVTDLGWRPHYEQIGQTGKTVHPKLYIGVGVSGAVQHTVGMQGSETIVAINRDPDSPLFKMADIGVVGDLNEILPVLTREIRAATGK